MSKHGKVIVTVFFLMIVMTLSIVVAAAREDKVVVPRTDELYSMIQEVQNELDAVQALNEVQEERITALESEIAEQTEDIALLKERIAASEAKDLEQDGQIASIIDGLKLTVYYEDLDGDGYGNDAITILSLVLPGSGYSEQGGDWDDDDATCFPGAPDLPDGKDNDGDGLIDEDSLIKYYLDADEDGYGDDSDFIYSVLPQGQYDTEIGGDFDDADNSCYPGAPEILDGKDNDCDGEIDEDYQIIYYLDADGDGYGDDSNFIYSVSPQPPYTALIGGDFDDANDSCFPGAPEILDGKDNDGDGLVDEDLY
jgi:uncharacterized coiled-coil protein SlyX